MKLEKILTVFTFILGFSPLVLSQIESEYCIEEIDSRLSFFMDGTYELVASTNTGDQFLSILLSYGNYIMTGNKIVSLDKINGYQMEFTMIDKAVHVVKSFKCYINKRMLLCGHPSRLLPISEYIMSSTYNEEALLRRLLFPVQMPLRMGLYGGSEADIELKVEFNSYKISFKHVVVSEGFWTIENGELSFFDSSLNQYFKGLIIYNGIKIYFLPNEEGELFIFEPYLKCHTVLNREIWVYKGPKTSFKCTINGLK